jgi:hypothetical protein
MSGDRDFAPKTTRLGPGCGGSPPRRGRNTSAQGNALGPGGIPRPSPVRALQDHQLLTGVRVCRFRPVRAGIWVAIGSRSVAQG